MLLFYLWDNVPGMHKSTGTAENETRKIAGLRVRRAQKPGFIGRNKINRAIFFSPGPIVGLAFPDTFMMDRPDKSN
jgi:hypothetical protein